MSKIINNLIGGSTGTVVKPLLGESGAVTEAFEFEAETTSADESFTIPCNSGTFDAVIDWGDGTTSDITAFNDADLTHTYSTAGTHLISITGTFPNVDFGNNSTSAQKVLRVTNLGKVGWQSLADAFRGCSNMTAFVAGNCNTSAVSNFSGMFRGASGMSSCLVGGMDTSSATNMRLMFIPGISLTELDLSTFDMSQVTDVHQMLRDYKGATPIDLSNFDMSNVEDMGQFMRGADNVTEIDVSNWVTSSVESIALIFDDCPNATITGLSSFDISLMTNATNALRDSALSTFEYDALLVAWEGQSHQNNVTFHAGSSTYTAGSAAATARAALIADGWTITDGGENFAGAPSATGSDWSDDGAGEYTLTTLGDSSFLTFAVLPAIPYIIRYTIKSFVGSGTLSVSDGITAIPGSTGSSETVVETTRTFTGTTMQFARGSGSDNFTATIANIQVVAV